MKAQMNTLSRFGVVAVMGLVLLFSASRAQAILISAPPGTLHIYFSANCLDAVGLSISTELPFYPDLNNRWLDYVPAVWFQANGNWVRVVGTHAYTQDGGLYWYQGGSRNFRGHGGAGSVTFAPAAYETYYFVGLFWREHDGVSWSDWHFMWSDTYHGGASARSCYFNRPIGLPTVGNQ